MILFSFLVFDLQYSAGRYGDCVADILLIESGEYREVFCGSDLPDDIVTSGNTAYIYFRSDETINGQGDNICFRWFHLINQYSWTYVKNRKHISCMSSLRSIAVKIVIDTWAPFY